MTLVNECTLIRSSLLKSVKPSLFGTPTHRVMPHLTIWSKVSLILAKFVTLILITAIIQTQKEIRRLLTEGILMGI